MTALTPSARTHPVRILDWKEMRKNTLIGFVKVKFASGMIVADVTIHEKNQSRWAAPPSKPMIDRGGVVLRDDNGKIRYSPIIEFASKEIRDRWSRAVIDAMRAEHPEVFDAEAGQ